MHHGSSVMRTKAPLRRQVRIATARLNDSLADKTFSSVRSKTVCAQVRKKASASIKHSQAVRKGSRAVSSRSLHKLSLSLSQTATRNIVCASFVYCFDQIIPHHPHLFYNLQIFRNFLSFLPLLSFYMLFLQICCGVQRCIIKTPHIVRCRAAPIVSNIF